MKFSITMKDPDGVSEAVRCAAQKSVEAIGGLNEIEGENLAQQREDEALDKLSKWFEYGEYLTVAVDTEAMTCVVALKNGKVPPNPLEIENKRLRDMIVGLGLDPDAGAKPHEQADRL